MGTGTWCETTVTLASHYFPATSHVIISVHSTRISEILFCYPFPEHSKRRILYDM